MPRFLTFWSYVITVLNMEYFRVCLVLKLADAEIPHAILIGPLGMVLPSMGYI